MPRAPKQYHSPQPSPASTFKSITPGEALIPPLGKAENLGMPSWVLTTLLGRTLKRYPQDKKGRLLQQLLAVLESAPFILEEIDHHDPRILAQLGGKESVLERFLNDISKKRRTCSSHTLRLHAAYLQKELKVWKKINSDRAWLEINLPHLLMSLNTIPCGCNQQTKVTKSLLDDLLYPLDRSTPTSASLLYAILGYHHDRVQPNTIQKRLQKTPR